MQLGRDFSLVTVATATFARPLHQRAVEITALLQVGINAVRAHQINEVTFRRESQGRADFAPPPDAEMTLDVRVTGIVDAMTVEMTKRALRWINFSDRQIPFDLLRRNPPAFTVRDVAELAEPLSALFRDRGEEQLDGRVRIPTLAEVNAMFDRARPPGTPSSSPGPGTPSTGPSFLKLTVAALVGVPALAWLVRKARS